jgi:uncharacterized protein YdaU (DUF1376 family)
MSLRDAFMPLYVGDYLRDTMHLSTLEHGAYLLLLMHYWTNGPLPNDDDALAWIARVQTHHWNLNLKPKLMPFFYLRKDGYFHQKRSDLERTKRHEVGEKRAKAAHSRWEREHANADANADANGGAKGMQTHARTRQQQQQQDSPNGESKTPHSPPCEGGRVVDRPRRGGRGANHGGFAAGFDLIEAETADA